MNRMSDELTPPHPPHLPFCESPAFQRSVTGNLVFRSSERRRPGLLSQPPLTSPCGKLLPEEGWLEEGAWRGLHPDPGGEQCESGARIPVMERLTTSGISSQSGYSSPEFARRPVAHSKSLSGCLGFTFLDQTTPCTFFGIGRLSNRLQYYARRFSAPTL